MCFQLSLNKKLLNLEHYQKYYDIALSRLRDALFSVDSKTLRKECEIRRDMRLGFEFEMLRIAVKLL